MIPDGNLRHAHTMLAFAERSINAAQAILRERDREGIASISRHHVRVSRWCRAGQAAFKSLIRDSGGRLIFMPRPYGDALAERYVAGAMFDARTVFRALIDVLQIDVPAREELAAAAADITTVNSSLFLARHDFSRYLRGRMIEARAWKAAATRLRDIISDGFIEAALKRGDKITDTIQAATNDLMAILTDCETSASKPVSDLEETHMRSIEAAQAWLDALKREYVALAYQSIRIALLERSA